jgi:hypothetical protein
MVDEVLQAARALLTSRDRTTGGGAMPTTWPRAVAFLGRQALEEAMDDFWRAAAPGVQQASRHAQLLCLGAYISDAQAVSRTRYAWSALSRACHHHAYELPPTAAELEDLLEAVGAFRKASSAALA